MKKIVYIDMDGVLVDFQSGIYKLSETQKNEFVGRSGNLNLNASQLVNTFCHRASLGP